MHILNQSDRALKYTPGPTDIYHVLYNHVTGVFSERGHVHISNVLAIMSSLARFALRTYNDQPQYVDEVLQYCHQAIEKADGSELDEERTVDELMELLHIPVDTYRNIISVLKLENYGKLFAPLDFDNKKTMALDIIEVSDAIIATSYSMLMLLCRTSWSTRLNSLMLIMSPNCWSFSTPCWLVNPTPPTRLQ